MNRRGFMMAEVIVVSAIVLVVLTTLYVSYNKIYSIYSTRLDYYDTVTLNRLGYYRDILIENDKINEILNKTKSININEIFSGNENLENEKNQYGIDDTYLFYNINSNGKYYLDNSYISDSMNQGLKDYITFLIDSTSFNSSYIMVMERCKEGNIDDCKYGYLEIYDGSE